MFQSKYKDRIIRLTKKMSLVQRSPIVLVYKNWHRFKEYKTLYSTDRTQPNRKRTQTRPRVRFRGLVGPRANPDRTQSKPRADPERTQSEPVKRTSTTIATQTSCQEITSNDTQFRHLFRKLLTHECTKRTPKSGRRADPERTQSEPLADPKRTNFWKADLKRTQIETRVRFRGPLWC